jgi:hypothetical protein
MASIQELKSLISQSGGLAMANYYRVELPSINGMSTRDLNILCKATNLPGRQIMTNNRTIGAIDQKVAYSVAHDDINLSFHVPNDYKIRTYFESWQAMAIDPVTHETGYLNEYAKTVKIHQLKRGTSLPLFNNSVLDVDLFTSDSIMFTCELYEAFPTTVTAIELSDATENATVELIVQLSYRKWKMA